MELTPLHLEILLHHYVSPLPFARKNLPAETAFHKDLERENFLTENSTRKSGWALTEKGDTYIRKILDEKAILSDEKSCQLITITLPKKEWEKYSHALADVICWGRGFNAAKDSEAVLSLNNLIALNLKIKGEI